MINSYECTNNLHSDDLLFSVVCDLCGGGFEVGVEEFYSCVIFHFVIYRGRI